MLFYKVLGIEITDLPVKQYVLYLGQDNPNINTTFKDEDMDYRYHVIQVKEIAYQEFLNSSNTDIALFAILADFGQDTPEYVIEKIGARMLRDADGELEFQKWQRQLEIISNIRNLQEKTIKILERMPIVLDIKKDLRYQQGAKEGLEQGVGKQATITVINMLLETNFSNRKIATLAAVKIPFVVKIEKALTKNRVKEVWKSFEIEEDNKTMITKRSIATAKSLLKIKSFSDDIIAKVTELEAVKVKQLRISETKKK